MGKYVGKRVVPKHCGAWTQNTEYEMLSIVLDTISGESYISKRQVPAGTLLTDDHYWSICSLFSQQIMDMGEELEQRQQAITRNNAETLQQIRADNDATETAILQDNTATRNHVDGVTEDALTEMNTAKQSFDNTSAALTARMDTIAGQTTGDTEILDARVDKDNVTHENLGSHIRSVGTEVSKLAEDSMKGQAIGYGAITEKHLSIIAESVNLIDTAIYESGYISSTTGKIIQHETYRTSDYIPVKEGERLYLLRSIGKGLGGYYDQMKRYIGPVGDSLDETDGTCYIIPAGVSYIRVCYSGSSSSQEYTPFLSKTKGAYYRPYEALIDPAYIPEQAEKLPSEIRNSFIINRLNPEEGIDGIYIPSSGAIHENDTYRATGFIRVEPGETIRVFRRTLRQENFRMVCAYDKDKNPVPSAAFENTVPDYTVPDGISFVRLTLYKPIGDLVDLMVTERANPEAFVSYGHPMIPKKYLPQWTFSDVLGQADIDTQTNFRVKYLATNIFNPEEYVSGYYIFKGHPAVNENYGYTGLLPVEAGYTVYCFTNKLRTVPFRFVDCYDASIHLLSDLTLNESVSSFTVPEGVAFIQVTIGACDPAERMIIMDDTPIKFYAYGEGMIRKEYLNIIKLNSDIHVHLPKDIYCAVGRTIEVYNNQVCLEAEKYHIRWVCKVGKAYKRKVTIVGVDSILGDWPLTLEIYNDELACIWTGTSTVHVVKNTLAHEYTCCPIGDSLTNGKAWLGEVMRLTDLKMRYVGTRPGTVKDNEGNTIAIGHEGRSGFSARGYIQGAPYTFNAPYEPEHHIFWDGERFNWTYYKQTYSIDPDIIQIYLGTNDMQLDNTNNAGYIKQIVDLIRQDDETIPIFVINTIYRGTQDAVGNQSGTDGYAAGVGSYKYHEDRKVMDLMQKLDALLQNYENVHMINLAVSHDSEYNFGAVETPVNPRASQTELMPIESVHPQQQGYFQMADVMFSVFCGVLD